MVQKRIVSKRCNKKLRVKGDSNMENLKEHIQSISEALKEKCVKVAFWKKEGRLYSYMFKVEYNHVIASTDKQFLENIQKDDPKAVVVNIDEGILSVRMEKEFIECVYDNGKENINDFLERYADKKQQQKVDISSLKEVVKHCWDRLWKERYSNAVFWKKDECWDYHMFFLSENNVIPREDEVLLRGIQKEDNNAIVIDRYSYRYLDGDGVAGYIANEIEKYHQYKCNGHNIGAFLDNYSWEAVQKKEKQEQEKQQKHWAMERSEIVEIMEKELKKLRDLSTQCTALDKSCMISNAMLKIAKYLTYEQEW